jgi:hypothetical protein
MATAGIAVSAVAFVFWAFIVFGLGTWGMIGGGSEVETGPIVMVEETPAP